MKQSAKNAYTTAPAALHLKKEQKGKRETEKEIGREGDMIGRKARQRGRGGETMRQGDRDRVGEGGGGGSGGLVRAGGEGEQAASLLSGVYREAFRDK